MSDSRVRNVVVTLVLLTVFAAAYYISIVQNSPSPEGPLVWKSFDAGVALARQTNKKILIDVYTDWCTWCKKMDSEVYVNKSVVALINDHFIAVKLNAESSGQTTYKGRKLVESELAREFGATGYPTTVFLDPESEPITSLPGYSPAEKFANVLGFIGKDYYKTISYQQYISQITPAR